MALALTLRKGHEVFVDDQRIVVSELDTALKFKVRRRDGVEFRLDPNIWQEVFADVWMQAGIPLDQQGTLVRLLIDAPREVKILRGDLYRKQQRERKQRRVENGND